MECLIAYKGWLGALLKAEAIAESLVFRPDTLGPAGEGLHHTGATNGDATYGQRLEKCNQKVIKNLLGERLFAGKAEIGGQLFGDRQADGVALGFAAAVTLIRQRDGRLHYCP